MVMLKHTYNYIIKHIDLLEVLTVAGLGVTAILGFVNEIVKLAIGLATLYFIYVKTQKVKNSNSNEEI